MKKILAYFGIIKANMPILSRQDQEKYGVALFLVSVFVAVITPFLLYFLFYKNT